MASQITVLNEQSPAPEPEEMDDAETGSENDEVDQLEDAEEDQLSSPVAIREKRLPGTTLFPVDAVERITQSYVRDVGATDTVGMSREASYVLSIATEEFVKRLALGSHNEALGERRNVVTYLDVAAMTQQYQEMFFLQETIPQPMALADALRAADDHEKHLIVDDPAIAPEPSADVPATYISSGYNHKSRGPGAHGQSHPHPYAHPHAHAPAPPPSETPTPSHAQTRSSTNGRNKPGEEDVHARRHPYRDETYRRAVSNGTNGYAHASASASHPIPPVPLAPSASASPSPLAPPHEYGGYSEPPSRASEEELEDQPYSVTQATSTRSNRSSIPIDALMNPTDTFADIDRGRTIYSQE
ncbi:hypothetical protein BD626DRAFT_603892 [Schizophyllum amplum]|uniref:Transcription factor CBF/NF-Y/archaeal histone domain-containing protein n=1 Tax=Schizophyllum amplum TaxID=97359 RepID=A0A550C7A3_9AGAR|nr:hypothetical protein BD626DRAFT_603892 [Auriculariopsis ampla]